VALAFTGSPSQPHATRCALHLLLHGAQSDSGHAMQAAVHYLTCARTAALAPAVLWAGTARATMLRQCQLAGTAGAAAEAVCQPLEDLAMNCLRPGVAQLAAAGMDMPRLCRVLRALLCYVPSNRMGLLSKWSEPLLAAVQEVTSLGGAQELQAAGCPAALGAWLAKLVGTHGWMVCML
jgi:hypothetical protein